VKKDLGTTRGGTKKEQLEKGNKAVGKPPLLPMKPIVCDWTRKDQKKVASGAKTSFSPYAAGRHEHESRLVGKKPGSVQITV